MGDRGGICVFLARANAHASKQAGETGNLRGGMKAARTHYECGSRQRRQQQQAAAAAQAEAKRGKKAADADAEANTNRVSIMGSCPWVATKLG